MKARVGPWNSSISHVFWSSWISGVIESNPRFGPLAFKALSDFYGGAGVPVKTIISDKEYTKDNAAAEVANAY